MLKIINDLIPFFQDNYERINVREYARRVKTTPPTASKLLSEYEKEGLLKKEIDKIYIYYTANKDSKEFILLSRIFYQRELKPITEYIKEELISPKIILFGSFSKAEINKNSDIDIAVFSVSGKQLKLDKFEDKLKRKIQLFQYKKESDVKNEDLLKNIQNGFILEDGL